jgi:transcriptional regulator with XRE-family HTH domain
LSQSDLAGRIGVSYQQVQKYESGQDRLTGGRLFEIAQVLSVPIADFFPVGGDGEHAGPPAVDGAAFARSFSRISDQKLRAILLQLTCAVADLEGRTGARPLRRDDGFSGGADRLDRIGSGEPTDLANPPRG